MDVDPVNNNQTETALALQSWQALTEGDREALGWLFRRYYTELYKYGVKICSNLEVLEDCIQELFIEIWQSKNSPPSISVKAYLLKALKYKLLKAMQKMKIVSLQPDVTEAGAFELSHESFLIARQADAEKVKKVVLALGQLTNRQKEIIYLKFYQNLDYEEVSEIMNINYQAARNLLHQAIKALKKILQQSYMILPFF
jgi:RNA polymerase sigma factor (sigma-70 family)